MCEWNDAGDFWGNQTPLCIPQRIFSRVPLHPQSREFAQKSVERGMNDDVTRGRDRPNRFDVRKGTSYARFEVLERAAQTSGQRWIMKRQSRW